MEEYNYYEIYNYMFIVLILIVVFIKFYLVKIMDNVVVVKWNSEFFNNRV